MRKQIAQMTDVYRSGRQRGDNCERGSTARSRNRIQRERVVSSRKDLPDLRDQSRLRSCGMCIVGWLRGSSNNARPVLLPHARRQALPPPAHAPTHQHASVTRMTDNTYHTVGAFRREWGQEPGRKEDPASVGMSCVEDAATDRYG